MPIVVLIVVVAAVAFLGRVGKRTATCEFPMTWPTTGALSEPSGRRLPALGIVIMAIFLGVLVGIFARIWMRLIAPDPEFTTAGTVGILAGFGLLFTGAGLSLAAHRNGWRRIPLGVARTIGCVLILPAFGGAGLLAFPSVIFGALAVARWDLRIPLRIFFGCIAIAATVLVALTQIPDGDLSAARTAIGIGLYPVLLWPMLLAARLSLIRTAPAEVHASRTLPATHVVRELG